MDLVRKEHDEVNYDCKSCTEVSNVVLSFLCDSNEFSIKFFFRYHFIYYIRSSSNKSQNFILRTVSRNFEHQSILCSLRNKSAHGSDWKVNSLQFFSYEYLYFCCVILIELKSFLKIIQFCSLNFLFCHFISICQIIYETIQLKTFLNHSIKRVNM